MKFLKLLTVSFILVFAFGLASQTVAAKLLKTGPAEAGIAEFEAPSSIPDLSAFARSIQNGWANQITGVYVEGVMAFPVVQQPHSDAGYVSSLPDTLTQFQMAAQYNTIGLLAHDYLAGAAFAELQAGIDVYLIYGDGSLKSFRVYEIQQYQALSPTDPYSNFVALSDHKNLSANQLFYHTYGLGNSTLVLQTCISTPSVPSWGRLFVLAQPVETARAKIWDSLSLFKQTAAGASAH